MFDNAAFKTFNIIAKAESVSYLLILLVGMPLKYLLGIKEPNYYIGLAHGVLFVLYLVTLFNWGLKVKMNMAQYSFGFLASFIPLGPQIFINKLRKGFLQQR